MKYINRLLAISAISLSTALLSTSVHANPNDEKASAGDINVVWGDFDKYRDVRSGHEPKSSFHKRVKKSFDKFFEEYSEELADGQSLEVTITDLDLAGEVLLGGTTQTRIMKDLDFPRMEFSYILTGADGEVLKQGDAKIKDMNYLYHEKTWKRYKEGFYYEKRMFREWFEKNIAKS